MFSTANGIRLYYERFNGESEDTTVLLHGWGADCTAMRGIYSFLSAQGKSVLMLDLPFFGKSDPPPESFGIYEYAETVRLFLQTLGLSKVNLVGHSFGGRIALILAAKDKTVNKTVLVDAAGLKPKRSLKYHLKVLIYKLKKRLRIRFKKAGSFDYNALPDFMKPVFVRVVNTHLDKILVLIECPVLLVWGENDRDTPLYMARKMHRTLKDSGLVVLKEAGHFAFLDKPNEFHAIIDAFL